MHKSVFHMIKWTAFEQIFRLIFQLILLIILARLLNPNDYGVFALLGSIQVFSTTFANAGLTDSLIQSRKLSINQESTIFYTSVIIAIIISIFLIIISPLLIKFYNYKITLNMIYLVIFNILFGSLGAIQFSKYLKNLNFKTPALIAIFSLTSSGIVSIMMAYNNYGVWSLLMQSTAYIIISVLLVAILSNWRPSLYYNYKEIESEIKFGINLLIARLLNVASIGLIDLVVGKVYTVDTLGFYNRAQYIQNTIVNGMSGIVGKVAYPKFSEIANDENKIKKSMYLVLFATSNFSVPVAILLFTCSTDITTLFLGEKWVESAYFLKILALDALIWPFQIFNVNLLMSLGRADLVLKSVIAKLLIIIIFLVIFSNNFDIKIFTIGYVAASYINCYINIYFTNIIIKIPFKYQIKSFIPSIKAGFPLYIYIYFINNLDISIYFKISFITIFGSVIFIISIAYLNNFDIMKYIKLIVYKKNNDQYF